MLRLLIESLIFVLPIYFANGFASLTTRIPIVKNWNAPIDFGIEWKGKRLLGKGKTFRGLIIGTLIGLLGGLIQYYLSRQIDFKYIEFFNSSSFSKIISLSFFLGFGALIGDLVKSFFKRRIGIESGHPWPVFDQLDFIAGALLFGSLIYFPGWSVTAVLVIVTPLLHLLSNITAYKLGLKDVWW